MFTCLLKGYKSKGEGGGHRERFNSREKGGMEGNLIG